MKPDPKGQPAVTVWKVLGRAEASPGVTSSHRPSKTGVNALLQGEVDHRRLAGDDRVGGVIASAASNDPPPQPSPARGEGAHRASGGRSGNLTWLALEPLTGRTHQLRVHCAEMGFPIVGDAIYGTAPRVVGPALHLHSREVVVPLYKNRDAIRVTAPVPGHMRERLSACGLVENDQ
jgi:tRNA pseudouridine32 synthase/23S rRNA pseudouridine746 synthase